MLATQQFVFRHNASLKPFNTLSLNSTAQYLADVYSEADLQQLLQSVTAKRLPLFVLSGGSNVLLPEYVPGVVLRPLLKGIRVLEDNEHDVLVEVLAGEEWHPFVQYCLAQGWYGLENLSLIPGFVGASPIQNIGAYGVEAGDCIEYVRAWHIQNERWVHIHKADCQFAYRDSIFKQQAGQWVISRVVFRLSKQAKLSLGYGDVQQQAGRHPTPQSVANAIIHIRQAKLPDPQKIPNVGSFFKNPVISDTQFSVLKQQYPSLSGYPLSGPQANPQQVKVAAGWLIEQAGWKGKRLGNVGMYEKQALVLVNHGVASLQDVQRTSQAVQQSVYDKFNIRLEQEPVLVPGATAQA